MLSIAQQIKWTNKVYTMAKYSSMANNTCASEKKGKVLFYVIQFLCSLFTVHTTHFPPYAKEYLFLFHTQRMWCLHIWLSNKLHSCDFSQKTVFWLVHTVYYTVCTLHIAWIKRLKSTHSKYISVIWMEIWKCEKC